MAKPSKTVVRLAPTLLVLSLALAGCGGDDDAVTTDADVLVPSKRDYLVRADTICARQSQLIETEAEVDLGIRGKDLRVTPSGEIVFKPGRAPSPEEIEDFGTETVIPALRAQLQMLRALTPPTGDEATVAAIYDTAEQGVDRLAADPSRFNDRAATRSALTEARRLSRRYGFFECGTYSGP